MSENRQKTPLGSEWSLHIFFKQQGNSSDQYEDNIHLLGTFGTIEGFWSLYSHLKKPNDVSPPTDYHLFRKGIRAIWEDNDNVNGGKWMIRLKKGLASYYWERLILALIGEQFSSDVNGAVVSVRFQEDIISLWNKTGNDPAIRQEIYRAICTALELPPGTKLEYKKHDESVRDHSSFRNTDIYQTGTDEAFELPQHQTPSQSPKKSFRK
ncbi:eukaryotic translation initiation factor 4E type 2 isoform X3 [Histomonas meleagridis]|uniref:eukaryotic translation initiation factor 4E type 2 isoform X3 n=1 Tax=Histomonas meleagridis TaxID=135588 RepID=UPI0035598175|nr:eukaryotic translation initiation factor 4E type 2 isoform X3 [Histomonas meleagridis]KAH0802310.1 eukaryotic translation initiation factor 4E type 2 isoform X3 [Histomonas meleagridis]